MAQGKMGVGSLFTRRKFVKLASVASATVILGGCSSEGGGAAETTDAEPEGDAEAKPADPEGAASAEAPEEEAAQAQEPKALVIVFSQTGNTLGIAEHVVEALGADMYRLETAEPYTSDDLNYNDSSTRATVEQNNPETRPELAGELPDISPYDMVFLGHPIWWGHAPRAVCGMVEQIDWAGKPVAEFCTSGSSGIDEAHAELETLAASAPTWVDARRFEAGESYESVSEWAASMQTPTKSA